MKIIGAGLAGLIAANVFQRAEVFEVGDEKQLTHRAVLRFRTRAVGDAVGVEFRPVTVHKNVYDTVTSSFVTPNVRHANDYSTKVIGKIADRSIWNLAPAQRWIAPETLVQQLAERCGNRIRWNSPMSPEEMCEYRGGPLISTIPMPALAKMLPSAATPQFDYQPITVHRWRVPHADVFQTVYFPSRSINLYRASITGDLLIAESMGHDSPPEPLVLQDAFGLDRIERIDVTTQRFGKIAPIDDTWRRHFILQMTLQHEIFSLGRFATWRNLLLDDVLGDVAVIRRLIAGGAYFAARSV